MSPLHLQIQDKNLTEFCEALSRPNFAKSNDVHIPTAHLVGNQRPNLFQVVATPPPAPKPGCFQRLLGKTPEAPREATPEQKEAFATNLAKVFKMYARNHGALYRQIKDANTHVPTMVNNLEIMKGRLTANTPVRKRDVIARQFDGAIENLKSYQVNALFNEMEETLRVNANATDQEKLTITDKFDRKIRNLLESRRPKQAKPNPPQSLCSRVTIFMAKAAVTAGVGAAAAYKITGSTDPTQLALGAGVALATALIAKSVMSSLCCKAKKAPAPVRAPAPVGAPALPGRCSRFTDFVLVRPAKATGRLLKATVFAGGRLLKTVAYCTVAATAFTVSKLRACCRRTTTASAGPASDQLGARQNPTDALRETAKRRRGQAPASVN